MLEVKLPFPYKIDKKDLHSFYLSFLVRLFVIQGQFGYDVKISKQEIYKALRKQGFTKWRVTQTWNKKSVWAFIKHIDRDYIILEWKDSVSWEKGFISTICIEDLDSVSYYAFCKFVSETLAQRPVTQKEEFYFRRKRSKAYNNEMTKRNFKTQSGRGQRKIANQSWCSLKTVNNRLKKSTKVKTLKRYDSVGGFKVRKTNLYFNLEHKVYFNYNNKKYSDKGCRTVLNIHHSLLIESKALFLNNSIGLWYADDSVYSIMVWI